jgi:hypothetical protein
MTFPSNADADPDPTTQMTWPSSRRNTSGSHILKSNYVGGEVESPQTGRRPLGLGTVANIKTLMNPAPKRRLTTKDLIFLSISMAGAQIAWTVELGCVFHGLHVSYTFISFLAAIVSRNHRGAYGLYLQIWDAVFIDFGIVGAAHVVGVVGGPHQRVDCPASHRYVHPSQSNSPPYPCYLHLPSFLAQWQNFHPSHNQLFLPHLRSHGLSSLKFAIFIHSNTFPLLYHNTTQ